MRPVRLEDLPAPPPGRTGWPWTVASAPLPPVLSDGSSWPPISIVTPSYNQGDFLEEAIRSVLLQSYPDIEYFVIDGDSTDGSRRVLEKYAPWLSYWTSEPDRGHYHALNKGFARARGEIMAWINSDDKYVPNAFAAVGEIFSRFSAVEWVTSLRPIRWDRNGHRRWCRRLPGFSREAFRRGEYVVGVGHFASGWIQQESTFWRRSLWQQAGGRLDDSLELAGDFELWTRFYEHTDLYGILGRLGGFRQHAAQQTANRLPTYIEEAERVFSRHGGTIHGRVTAFLRKWITRCPPFVRRSALGIGLSFPGKIIVPSSSHGGWRIENTAV